MELRNGLRELIAFAERQRLVIGDLGRLRFKFKCKEGVGASSGRQTPGGCLRGGGMGPKIVFDRGRNYHQENNLRKYT